MSGASGTVQYGYNGENRLISVQPKNPVEGDKRVQFCYDYMGRRVQKSVYSLQGGAWVLDSDTRFLYDGWNLVQEWDSTGTNQKSYLWGLDLSQSLVDYQPKVDIGTGRTSGTEALIRWQRTPDELVPPYEFIPLAEESGLIVPMGVWILRRACRQTRIWQKIGFSDLTVAVNLSARQFQEDNLPETVYSVLTETGLSPQYLNLEITENILMADVDASIETMDRLSKMGIKLSIDDFGTGYSSLNYLKKFPVDILKIDRSFVRDIPDDTNDMAIAKAVIALGQSLNLKVVAEGVETPEQVEFMRKYGADEIQGYVFCRPLPADRLSDYLHEESSFSEIGATSRDSLTGKTTPVYPFSPSKPACPSPSGETPSTGRSAGETPDGSEEEKNVQGQ